MAPSRLVVHEEVNGLATLTLNRPEKLNALTPELFEELDTAIGSIRKRPDEIGVVIIRGSGRAFSAGNDLSTPPETGQLPSHPARTITALARLPQPVIAAVHGHCLTGGLELALGADIILAAESARFGDTHARWGLSPRWGLSQRLPRRVGMAHALELMATSRLIDAREAVSIGLAEHCWPDHEFAARLAEFAASVLSGSWHSLQGAKRLLHATRDLPIEAGLAFEIEQSPGRSADSASRIAGFRR